MSMIRSIMALFIAPCLLLPAWDSQAAPIRNVIFLMGDGMGDEQIKAGRYYVGADLSFESFPYHGRMTTASANDPVTDSAAAATAMATGHKTINDAVGITPGGQVLENVVEYFQQRGKKIGVATTGHLASKTWAGFTSHAWSSNLRDGIASNIFFNVRPDVLLGGGGDYHAGFTIPRSYATSNAYVVVTNRAEMLSATQGSLTLRCQIDDGAVVYVNGAGGVREDEQPRCHCQGGHG